MVLMIPAGSRAQLVDRITEFGTIHHRLNTSGVSTTAQTAPLTPVR